MTNKDISARPIGLFAAGVAVLIGVCIIAALGVLRITTGGAATADEQEEVAGSPRGAPPAPVTRLQISPQAELAAFARDKADVLRSYAWVDRRANRVRIPIAQAIELAVLRGLPVFAPTQTTTGGTVAPTPEAP